MDEGIVVVVFRSVAQPEIYISVATVERNLKEKIAIDNDQMGDKNHPQNKNKTYMSFGLSCLVI